MLVDLGLFSAVSRPKVDLPFDDDDTSGPKYGEDFDTNPTTPTPTPNPRLAQRYPIPSILSLIRAREFVAISVVVFYFAWVIVGHLKVRGIASMAMSTTMSYLGDFYAAVPQRFVRPHVHRLDAFSTGRTHHRGVLTSIVLTKRCDPLGFL
jgi:hypothetical protein